VLTVVVACVLAAAVVVLLPLLTLAYRVIDDALNPLPNRPAPYSVLPPPSGVVPPGDLVVDANISGNYEIYLMSPSGRLLARLTDDPHFDSWWGRISPDRRHILFYRSPRGVHDTNAADNALWVMDADGSHGEALLPVGTHAWRVQGHAEWSPNGRQLVMLAGSLLNSQIYVTTATGADPVDVTDRRPGSNIDPSWLPSGRGILFVGCATGFCIPSSHEVYRLSLAAGSKPVQLTRHHGSDYDPYASPNGREVAWLQETAGGHPGQWNIMVASITGADERSLTHTDGVDSKPSWADGGSVIYFHRLEHTSRGNDFAVWRIRLDGTGLHQVLAVPGDSVEYPGT
jgi:Tol biopolymer transport system component